MNKQSFWYQITNTTRCLSWIILAVGNEYVSYALCVCQQQPFLTQKMVKSQNTSIFLHPSVNRTRQSIRGFVNYREHWKQAWYRATDYRPYSYTKRVMSYTKRPVMSPEEASAIHTAMICILKLTLPTNPLPHPASPLLDYHRAAHTANQAPTSKE